MADTPDYAKWIEAALAANPKLSKAGLSRHLGHGSDRSRVIKMLDGTRRIQIEEITAIASYLGVPPPGVAVDVKAGVAAIRIAGIIAAGLWLEPKAPPMTRPASVPPVLDPRYPVADQAAYEMACAHPDHAMLIGDYLIAIPPKAAGRPPHPGEIVVLARERAGLEQLALGKASERRGGREADALDGGEPGRVVAIVIGVFRPIG